MIFVKLQRADDRYREIEQMMTLHCQYLNLFSISIVD